MLGPWVPWWTCRHRRNDLYLVWWQVVSMWRCQLSWLKWCVHWRWSSLITRLSRTWTACLVANSWRQYSWHSCDWHHRLIIWCAQWRCRLYLRPPAGPCQPLSQTSGWPSHRAHIQEYPKDHSQLIWVVAEAVITVHGASHNDQRVHQST